MLTAERARELTDNALQYQIKMRKKEVIAETKQLLKDIEPLILQAAEEGLRYTRTPRWLPIDVHDAFRVQLEKLGYKLSDWYRYEDALPSVSW